MLKKVGQLNRLYNSNFSAALGRVFSSIPVIFVVILVVIISR
ncbi:hypothetical protein R84B8_01897 [Treponema sp. R8-4-B8]